MQIICFVCLFFAEVLYAQSRTETPSTISYSVSNMSFEEVQLRISNELQVNAFNIVHEINIAKSLEAVSKSLDKPPLIEKAISIGFCKPSVSYTMLEKNIDALLYCPLKLLIFQAKDSPSISISFLKAPQLNEQIDPKKLDETIENIITSGLD